LEAAVPDNRADGHAASGHSAVRRDRFARRANWLQLAWSSRLSVPRNCLRENPKSQSHSTLILPSILLLKNILIPFFGNI
jgi:hypothetical protein